MFHLPQYNGGVEYADLPEAQQALIRQRLEPHFAKGPLTSWPMVPMDHTVAVLYRQKNKHRLVFMENLADAHSLQSSEINSDFVWFVVDEEELLAPLTD